MSTLGIPYIDDNVASKESAIYIGKIQLDFFHKYFNELTSECAPFSFFAAITIGVRILGPSAGFILGSFCTRLFVDLSDPGFGPNDPKWVGAWYLGEFLFIDLFVCYFSPFQCGFYFTNNRKKWLLQMWRSSFTESPTHINGFFFLSRNISFV